MVWWIEISVVKPCGDCAWLRRRICEGDCAHLAGIAKSNSIGLRVSLSYHICVWVLAVPLGGLALGATN
jgi:hypothetical protein